MVALIRRDRPSRTLYTVPGGNVSDGEDIVGALLRELAEELLLDPSDAGVPELCWIQDYRVSRPGPTQPPRKLHLVFRCFITPAVRAGLAEIEPEDPDDRADETGFIEWHDYRALAGLSMFPLIGAAAAELPAPDAPAGNPYLPPVTDGNYTWI